MIHSSFTSCSVKQRLISETLLLHNSVQNDFWYVLATLTECLTGEVRIWKCIWHNVFNFTFEFFIEMLKGMKTGIGGKRGKRGNLILYLKGNYLKFA